MFVDSDDYIAMNMVEKLYNNALESKSDIAICNICFDKNGKITESNSEFRSIYKNHSEIKDGLLKLYYTNNLSGIPSPCNKLYNAEFLKKNNLKFDINLIRGEDFWFNFDCFKTANTVTSISDCLYYYNQDNISSTMHNKNYYCYDQWKNSRIKLIDENKVFKFTIDNNLFYKNFLINVTVLCRSFVKSNDYFEVLKIWKDDFYVNAAKFNKNLPIHIKIINFLVSVKLLPIAKLLLLIW